MGDGQGRTEIDPAAVRLAVGGLEDVKEVLGEVREDLVDIRDRLEAEWIGTAKEAYRQVDVHTQAKLLRMQVQAGLLHRLVMKVCDDRSTLDLDVAQAASGCGSTRKGEK